MAQGVLASKQSTSCRFAVVISIHFREYDWRGGVFPDNWRCRTADLA
jgi:hypothetical protein